MQSPQLCLFCAARRGLLSGGRRQVTGRSTRSYISRTNPLQRPAGAAAQERDDDDEDQELQTRWGGPRQVAHGSRSPAVSRGTDALGASRFGGQRTFQRSTDPYGGGQRGWQRSANAPGGGSTLKSNSPSPQHSSDASDGLGSLLESLARTPPSRPMDSNKRAPEHQSRTLNRSEGQGFSMRRTIDKNRENPRYQDQSLAAANGLPTSRRTQDGQGFSVRRTIDTRGQNPRYGDQPLAAANDLFASRPTQDGQRFQRARPDIVFGRTREQRPDSLSGRPHQQSTSRTYDNNTRSAPRASWRDQRQAPFGRPGRQPSHGQRGEEAQAEPLPAQSDDLLDFDEGLADTAADQEVDRHRARRTSRSDRYATSHVDTPVAEEDEKAQRVKNLAKEREIEDLESYFEGGSDKRRKKKKKQPEPKAVVIPSRPSLTIPAFISVQHMAQALGLRLEQFVEKLEEEGFEGATYDHLLDSGTSSMLAELYGFEPVLATAEAQTDLVARPTVEDPTLLPPRPPIVTIMGHVDHGKTTILDYLRKANVVASEHGGITQHIGAFSVVMPVTERRITFLDTPGHAAFLDMRRRGANVTDIVVLVVAADDSVMPQTREAIKHALDAGVQIIVAMNKIDKPDADLAKVKNDLARENIVVEDLGGDYQAIGLSGKTGQGMDALEEAIITLADVSDFRADTTGAAEGWIIESKVTSAGRVATVLVRRGTLHIGDWIVAGNTWARVRTLRNDVGELVSEALPGTPVQIDGWRGEDPVAGLEVLQANDEQHAKDVVAVRLEKAEALRAATDTAAINTYRAEAADARAKVLEWQAEQGFRSGRQQRIRLRDTRTGWIDTGVEAGPRKVHFIVKADVAGSVEAIVAAVSAIGNDEVQANVIHSGTGMLNESDIRMLATSGEVSYGISFNQAVDGTIFRLAEAAEIEILDYNVIYKLTDAVKDKVSAELPPLMKTRVVGEAEVLKLFEIGKKNNKQRIAGCSVTNGVISRAQKVRVLRGDTEIFTGKLAGLKNVKKDVSEMRKGSECGMAFENWENALIGDKIQCLEEIAEPRKLY